VRIRSWVILRIQFIFIGSRSSGYCGGLFSFASQSSFILRMNIGKATGSLPCSFAPSFS
jgi:hypothetical protein